MPLDYTITPIRNSSNPAGSVVPEGSGPASQATISQAQLLSQVSLAGASGELNRRSVSNRSSGIPVTQNNSLPQQAPVWIPEERPRNPWADTVGRRTLVRPDRATLSRVNMLAPKPKRDFDPWALFVKVSTFCFPGFCLNKCYVPNGPVQNAWREKIALLWIIAFCCGSLGFITYGLELSLCQPDLNSFDYNLIQGFGPAFHPNTFIVSGSLYDMSGYLSTHAAFAGVNSQLSNKIAATSGLDISNYFRSPSNSICSGLFQSNITLRCSSSDFSASYCHGTQTAQNALKNLRIGPITYDWSILNQTSHSLIVFRSAVIDVTEYLGLPVPPFGPVVDSIIRQYLGQDATKAFFDAGLSQYGDCMASLKTIGQVYAESTGCYLTNVILWVSLIIIGSLVVVRFVLAVTFSWFISSELGKLQQDHSKKSRENRLSRRSDINAGLVPFTMQLNGEIAIGQANSTPFRTTAAYERATLQHKISRVKTQNVSKPKSVYGKELYTIMLVTCYCEDEKGLRTTFDSLALTDYSEDHKVMFIVADGLIKGAGNTKTTPDIIKEMLEMDSNWGEPIPLSYTAIGDGSKAHNKAQIYVAWYSCNDRIVPTILVVKCGTEEEAKTAKPGNRGKRDSQMLLMRFLQKVTFNERMTPFEYELFLKLHYLMGVTPDHFEIMLMVDADTRVAPDSLSRMVACMVRDERVMGLCGETRIANKADSWVSRIQVFEYYMSHHLNKAFESIFGGVTCLPGCFCMYRIKSPKDGFWVPILCAPEIVDTYSECIVETLHKKNLLLLGEDRFLTTLMLRAFPRRKLIFVPSAFCKTTVPNTFKVLLSQRRRWINSTIHNLMELLLVNNLCGIFCFSMQFVIFLELLGTVTLPAAIIFTLVVIVSSAIGPVVQLIPIILLGAILGLPALLILLTSRRLAYIYWMFIYLAALPIWNFVLPLYAFWHFDDFSWGETRKVDGDKKDGHGESDGKRLMEGEIPMRFWVDWERERRQSILQNWLKARKT